MARTFFVASCESIFAHEATKDTKRKFSPERGGGAKRRRAARKASGAMLATLAPLHHPAGGSPPRSGEEFRTARLGELSP